MPPSNEERGVPHLIYLVVIPAFFVFGFLLTLMGLPPAVGYWTSLSLGGAASGVMVLLSARLMIRLVASRERGMSHWLDVIVSLAFGVCGVVGSAVLMANGTPRWLG